MSETATKRETEERTKRRGKVACYHRAKNGKGAALRLEMKDRGDGDNACLFLEMAHQQSEHAGPGRGGVFDWENKATVKLNFLDVCEIVAVLEGLQAQAGGSRNGLYHEASGMNTIISCKASDTQPGYYVGISRKSADGEQLFKGHILLSPVEALGLRHVLQASLYRMTFGQAA